MGRAKFFAIVVVAAAALLLAREGAWSQQQEAPPLATPQLETPKVEAPMLEASKKVHITKDQAAVLAHHHYGSPAERAMDALIMTEIAAALSDEGLTDDYPIVIDSDHGVVTLSGVLPTREDIRRAVEIAQSADGVVGVRNKIILARH